MQSDPAIRKQPRYYLVLQTPPSLLPLPDDERRAWLHDFATVKLPAALGLGERFSDEILKAHSPSLDWSLKLVSDLPAGHQPSPDRLIIATTFKTSEALLEYARAVLDQGTKPLPDPGDGSVIVGAGADPGGASADHWCPGSANLAVFGTRADARRLIGADALHQGGLTGKDVNVVIIDEGLDQALIPPKNWGGGIAYQGRLPGDAPPDSHGMLIARNVLDLAPDAVLYDVPLIPPRITNIPVFASDANAIYLAMILVIPWLRTEPRWAGPWVVSNAWAIFDRASEVPLGSYTENLQPGGHPLNNAVGEIVDSTAVDVAFAAGNCGEFCPSQRCGPVDRGPGHSIWGANAHPAVITAGAVRTDETWLGYSSQGPGPVKLSQQKPDLCAPSNFTDTLDAHAQNTGTSAACALLVGAVAALRSKAAIAGVPPGTLKQALLATTRETHGAAWDARLGNGVLDVEGVIAALP